MHGYPTTRLELPGWRARPRLEQLKRMPMNEPYKGFASRKPEGLLTDR